MQCFASIVTLQRDYDLRSQMSGLSMTQHSPISKPRMVVFDLYGTLVQFGVMKHAYRQILQWAREQGRTPQPDDARQLMTRNGNPATVFASLGIFPTDALLAQFTQDIRDEMESLCLFDDVLPTLETLVGMDITIGICSNLATPYGEGIERLLPGFTFVKSLSYEAGAIKPEPAMYDDIVVKSGIPVSQTWFVGDTWLADYDGPTRYGFHAWHLMRNNPVEDYQINSLIHIITLIQTIKDSNEHI
jgi:FMN phosphatase YigB (HAD superfamily)